jgi:hypothetical protein
MITGHSLESKKPNDIPLKNKFSSYGLIWGWATWRRVWNLYDVQISSWDHNDKDFLLNKECTNSQYVAMWSRIFDITKSGKVDTWDYQLNFLLLKNNMLCSMPPYNLIDNIGYGYNATHTFGSRPRWLVESSEIEPNKIHFAKPIPDPEISRIISSKIFGIHFLGNGKYYIKMIIMKVKSICVKLQ